MRRLRSCSTIATFPVQVRPVSDLPGPREAGLRAIMNDFSGPRFRADLRPSIDAVVHNYKGMNELSKDVVSWLTVDEDSAGQRIDNFLARILKGVPKSHLYRILRTGEVRVNKGRVGAEKRLALGDVVRVPPVRRSDRPPSKQRPPRSPLKLVILFEDEAVLAIDKRAGLAVHGGSGISYGLIEQLRATHGARFLELVHRLDRDTSGVLLVAKKRAALVALHEQLRHGGVDKRYLVLVRGRWLDEKRTVRLSLHKFSTREGERRVRVDEGGRESETIFHRRRSWPDHDPPLTLLEAELRTGRTHQIRVHLAHLGYTLAGDEKYGDFAWNKTLGKQGLRRMFLHAWKLSFTHPQSGSVVTLESPLPLDLQHHIARLDASG